MDAQDNLLAHHLPRSAFRELLSFVSLPTDRATSWPSAAPSSASGFAAPSGVSDSAVPSGASSSFSFVAGEQPPPRQHGRDIAAALAQDAACRRPKVTEGLYSLGDLAPFERLGHCAPVLRAPSGTPFSRAASDDEYRDRYRRAAPFLSGFDLRAHGLRLAGGAASAILMHASEAVAHCHDFDLFLVGHASDLEARRAIVALAEHLRRWTDSELDVYRTLTCITFVVHDLSLCLPRIVQVVLRRYSTEGEVIHGFDMGSCAVLWDGERVTLTALGKLAAERGANVLNLPARRDSYERRLAKYFGRGYDLVLPDLDAAALVAAGGRMPYLFARELHSGGCGCSLWAYELSATRPGRGDRGEWLGAAKQAESPDRQLGGAAKQAESSDYQLGDLPYDTDDNAARNVRALERGRPAALCAHAPYRADVDVFGIEPRLRGEELHCLVDRALRPAAANLGALRELMGAELFAEILTEYARRGEPPAPEALARQCAARAEWFNARASIPFAFMGVEDRTALTGPFQRAELTAAQWYGAAFRG